MKPWLYFLVQELTVETRYRMIRCYKYSTWHESLNLKTYCYRKDWYLWDVDVLPNAANLLDWACNQETCPGRNEQRTRPSKNRLNKKNTTSDMYSENTKYRIWHLQQRKSSWKVTSRQRTNILDEKYKRMDKHRNIHNDSEKQKTFLQLSPIFDDKTTQEEAMDQQHT